MLDALLKEFGSSFPEFKRVLIDERDMYLTHSLRSAYQPVPNEFVQGGFSPACVVGVIGLGHMQGTAFFLRFLL
jgi:pheromone shutdown protein TraB